MINDFNVIAILYKDFILENKLYNFNNLARSDFIDIL